MAIEAGRMLGDYRIIQPIGAGGMGEVYLSNVTCVEVPRDPLRNCATFSVWHGSD